MALIVIKNFVLTLEDGIKQAFVAGEKIVGELADHWFVKAHCIEDAEAADTTDAPKAKGKKAKANTPAADTTDAPINAPTDTPETPAA